MQLLPALLALVSPAAAAGQRTCAITDHGASTSAHNNTRAIQSAIGACAGGGTVVVKGGHYKTGPLVVAGAKGLTIEVQQGSSLVAAFGPDDWPVTQDRPFAASLRDTPTPGPPPTPTTGHYQDFLVFDSCDHCGLTGEGTLFGKGGRPPTGFDWYYLFDQGKLKHSRPMFLTVSASRNFTMKGITLLDAPEFNMALNGVTGAEISHVNITSTWYTDPKTGKLMEPHNTDGIVRTSPPAAPFSIVASC